MPISGVVCGYDDSFQPFDHCINCHQNRDKRNCHFPTFALKLMRDNDYKRKGAGYSATTLLACPRAVALLEKYDYYEDLESGWNKIRGELLHAAFESDTDVPHGIIKEKRLSKTVTVLGEEITITGKADEIDTEFQAIIDYKFTGAIPEQDKGDHIAQFNVYAWLCNGGTIMETGEKIDIEIKHGGMYYMTLKKKKKRDGTIIRPWHKRSYPVWSEQATEAFVVNRLEPLVHFKKTGVLPQCNPYEKGRWQCECEKILQQLSTRGIRIEEDETG